MSTAAGAKAGLPLYVPFGYSAFLFGLLWLFSRHYRARASRRKPPAPWFSEPHTARDVYISLLSVDPQPPQPILVAALLARAITDVKRIWAVRDAKQALTALLAKGQIGDDTWERVLIAEKELEAEIVEVAGEANEYSAGWGQAIFAIANEAATAQKSRDLYRAVGEERERQDRRLMLSSDAVESALGTLTILGSLPASIASDNRLANSDAGPESESETIAQSPQADSDLVSGDALSSQPSKDSGDPNVTPPKKGKKKRKVKGRT